jgi:ribosomal-protein-alanine acetyltransferase
MFIREMDVDDLERIVELEKDLFTSPWNKDDFIYELNENPFSYNYVLLENEIIGYIGLWINYDNASITTIGVDKRYQGRGYSEVLMDQVIDLVNENKCINMSLEVRVSNNKAIHLYEKYGFKKVALRKNYYQDNHEDAYLMIKEMEEE